MVSLLPLSRRPTLRRARDGDECGLGGITTKLKSGSEKALPRLRLRWIVLNAVPIGRRQVFSGDVLGKERGSREREQGGRCHRGSARSCQHVQKPVPCMCIIQLSPGTPLLSIGCRVFLQHACIRMEPTNASKIPVTCNTCSHFFPALRTTND